MRRNVNAESRRQMNSRAMAFLSRSSVQSNGRPTSRGGIFRRRLRLHRTCTRHRIFTGQHLGLRIVGGYARNRYGARDAEEWDVDESSVCKESVIRHQYSPHTQNSLKAKAPVMMRPSTSRMKPRRNWLPLPTVGRNGLPAAACQTSCSEESMCPTRKYVETLELDEGCCA